MMQRNIIIPNNLYIQQFARLIAKENIKLLSAHGQSGSQDDSDAILNSFLISYIELLIIRTLTDDHGGLLTNEELCESVTANFLQLKQSIQDAVGTAFSTAMTNYTGEYVDYYAYVEVSPEPINERPC